MNLELLKSKEYPLLGRKEYLINCEFDKTKTPSNADIKKESASLLKVAEDLVVIKNIKQEFGLNKSKALVYVYKDQNMLKKVEIINKKPKKQPAQEEAKK